MKNIKSAFSLGEVLVTLAIVGIIASLIIPIIKQTQPDRQKVLFRKAYSNIERVVTELINDDYLYPEATKADGTPYEGLDNVTNEVELNDETAPYTGGNKFCNLITLKLNTISSDDNNCPGTPGGNGTFGTPSFTTNEGIAYFIPSTTFATDATITIDTNGDKAPNCRFNATSCKSPDMFEIIVSPDGGIHVNGDIEKSYLKSTSIVRE